MRQAGRGQTPFSPDILLEELQMLGAGEMLAPAHCAAYRAFYHLEFPHLEHTHSMHVLPWQGEQLVQQFFVPEQPRASALLVHGYYDHVGLYGHLIDYLMRRGVAVACFDQLGHGLSSGPRATIDSFDRYVGATRAIYAAARQQFELRDDEPMHWIGQSMGGAIVMETLQQHPPAEAVAEIVLLAPLVRPYAWWLNRWVFALAKLAVKERPRELTANAENPEFLALQQVDPLQAKVLPVAWVQAMVNWYHRFRRYPVSQFAPKMVQGTGDKTVDWRYNLALYERRYPASKHLVIPYGRHHLVNEAAQIREQMWAWLDQHCSWRID